MNTLRTLAIATVVALTGCGTPPITTANEWMAGYLCCNLHYIEGQNWISDANFTNQPFVPAGARVRVAVRTRDYRTRAEIGGAVFWFGLDTGWPHESFENWLRRIVIDKDPRTTISSWPVEVQRAIQHGKVRIGMTREQVLVALGPPPRALGATYEASDWKYWHSSGVEYAVRFDNNGVTRVTHKVDSLPDVVQNGTVTAEY